MALAVPIIAEASKNLEIVQTESLEEFMEACRKAACRADILFVAGGDGTVHAAIQALSDIQNPPPVGILPSGTCNDFARTLEIPMALDQAAEILVAGEVKEIDIVQINQGFFLNFAGIGIITDASSNIDPHLKERYGKLSYFISGIQSMRQAVPFQATLTIDGIDYTEECVLILVMNGKSIGTHIFPLPSINPADGLLDVFIIQNSSISVIWEWFSLSNPDIAAEELEHIIHYQGRNIMIRTEEEKEIDTDGEVYLKTPAKIAIHPGKLKMLVSAETEEIQ